MANIPTRSSSNHTFKDIASCRINVNNLFSPSTKTKTRILHGVNKLERNENAVLPSDAKRPMKKKHGKLLQLRQQIPNWIEESYAKITKFLYFGRVNTPRSLVKVNK